MNTLYVAKTLTFPVFIIKDVHQSKSGLMNPSSKCMIYDLTSTATIHLCCFSIFRDKVVIHSQLKLIMDEGELQQKERLPVEFVKISAGDLLGYIFNLNLRTLGVLCILLLSNANLSSPVSFPPMQFPNQSGLSELH